MITFSAPARGSRWGEGAGVLASPERGGRRIAPEGFPAVRRIPLWKPKANSYDSLAAPFGGSAAAAAKGVSLVTLRCYHSTNSTPSVSPFGLPAPPSGSQEGRCVFARDFIKR